MFKILAKEQLASNVTLLKIHAPLIARKVSAGQFIILRVSEKGERIPLTVAKDLKTGSITIIFQHLGKTTTKLSRFEPGDNIQDILGPLGHATEPVENKTVITIGGGVGAAEILPVSLMYRNHGNKVIGIVGARNKDLIILDKQMKAACNEFYLATDDGSAGQKGFVSNILQDLINKGVKPDIIYAIGPVPMMKAISNQTKPLGIKTIVSLNPIMLDGTGMCGACRVTINGETKFACVDGPEFDGHSVDWAELTMRLSAFSSREKIAISQYEKECTCNHQE